MVDKVASQSALAPSQSARAVLLFGLVLGLVLAAAGGYVVVADREHRLVAAERQSVALVVGGERLVWLELRNLERALRGLASDTQRSAHAPAALREAIRGVLARQPELESVVVTDARGVARTPGRDEPALPQWLAPARRGGGLAVGPLQRSGAQWTLPLALATGERRIVARLRSGELQRLLASLDTGRKGRVQLLDAAGTIVADSRGPGFTGLRRHARPPGHRARVERRHVGDLDRVARVQASRAIAGYPLRIRVGLARTTILAPWWRLAAAAAALYLLYWTGIAYLVRVIRRHSQARAHLLDEVNAVAERLRLAQQLGRTGTWQVDPGDRIRWSEQVSQMLGRDVDANSATLAEFYEQVHPDDRARVAAQFAQAWRTGEPVAIDYRVRGADGRLRWLSCRGACIHAADGNPRMTGTVVDITERMEAQQRLEDAERHFRYLFDHNPLPFWVFDVQTLRFLEVNEAALEQYGYSREEFLAMTILDIRPPEQQADVLASVAEVTRCGFGDARVWLHRRKDGVLLEVRVSAADIDFRGRPARLVLAEDVSERMAQQRELSYRASHDIVTGLLNAHALAEEVEVALSPGCTLAYVQVRGIEAIGDSLGRKAGEDMLRTLARRLQRLGQKYGAVGHVRGEEFALAVRESGRMAEALAELQHELARPLQGHDLMQRLEFWIGLAEFPADGAEALQVLANAGLAAHQARAERLPLVRFKAEMAQRASERLRLAGRVHQALDTGGFALHFQLIRRVADGRPAALEALIRWPQPQGGFIPPAEFIGICEDSGLIVPLGRWVLREAAAAQRRLSDAGFPHLPIAVNVSLVQFLHGDLAADVDEAVARYGLRRGALHVELTESVLMTRPDQALTMLRQLQLRGVCVSLDDFGTGFSSMSYLRHLPLDALKIDRSFVHEVDRDARNASICQALLALGRSLGLTVVAEGVESEAQFRWLREHHCDQMQGYGLDRPAPLDEVITRLAALQRAPSALPWAAPLRARRG